MEIARRDGAGAFAIAGVMEYERSDGMLCEENLDGVPIGQALADSMEDEDCGDGGIEGTQGDGLQGAILGAYR
jgi:hypothetical protein